MFNVKERELVNKISYGLPEEYSKGEITVKELVQQHEKLVAEFNKIIIETDPNENQYAENMTSLTFKLGRIIELIEMRKLENNPQDALVIIDYMKNTVDELEKFYKERV